jgi:hypothetical protein
MWVKFINYASEESFSKKNTIEFNQIYGKYSYIDDSEKDEIVIIKYKSDGTPYLVRQIKKDMREKEFANILNPSILKSFIGDFVKMKTVLRGFSVGYFNKKQSIYQRFFGYENKLKSNILDTVVFDLKKKQLYSNFLKNLCLKKFLTNGTLLNKLRIFTKNRKKSMTIYGYNIKYFFGELVNTNYVIEIVGCKNHIFKIIKFIKKYHKMNSVFIFTPKRSFFKSQYKKISSIKKKNFKRYSKYLKY